MKRGPCGQAGPRSRPAGRLWVGALGLSRSRTSTSGVSGRAGGILDACTKGSAKTMGTEQRGFGSWPFFLTLLSEVKIFSFSKIKPFWLLLEKISIHTMQNTEKNKNKIKRIWLIPICLPC